MVIVLVGTDVVTTFSAAGDAHGLPAARSPSARRTFGRPVMSSVEASETSMLISFVAAGIGVAIVPASVAHLTVSGAVYRPLAGQVPLVELANAWRRADNSAVVRRALEIARQSAALLSQRGLPVETGRSRTVDDDGSCR